MKTFIIAKDHVGLSTRAGELYDKLLDKERKARGLAEKYSKYSSDKAIHLAAAEAYSMAALIFVHTYGKTIKSGKDT